MVSINKVLNWTLRYHTLIHAFGEMSIMVITLAGALIIFNQPAAASTITLDPLQTRVRAELGVFTGWLQATGSKGYIGEVGWPDNTGGDAASWNALANVWYQDADKANLWVTPWSTGAWWGTTYKLSPYQQNGGTGGVNTPNTQANILEAHPPAANYRRGVNVSGAEFGTGGSFTNTNPGTYGVNYIYDPTGTFNYLAGRGENVIRMPIRWERIQHTLGGPLDSAELQRLTDAVNRAGASGLGVIIDLHNYGEYQTAGGRQTIGQGVSTSDLDSVWQLLSQSFKGNSSVVAYDLMNEPHDIGGANAAKTWEQASQSALSTIRANGDNKLIMVPGYNWSGTATWAQTHPTAWISDPANNFRYEAHAYWDRNTSGVYANSYSSEVANAVSRGYGTSEYAQATSAAAQPAPVKTVTGSATSNTATPSPAAQPTASPKTSTSKNSNQPSVGATNSAKSTALPIVPDKPATASTRVQEVLVASAHSVAGAAAAALGLIMVALIALEIKLRRSRAGTLAVHRH